MQNLKNLAAATKVLEALVITTASTTTYGTTIDRSTLPEGQDISFIAKAHSLGGGTVTFKVQESADNFTTPVDVAGASFVAVADTPVMISLVQENRLQYVRLVAVLAGATSAVFSGEAIVYALKRQPVDGSSPIVV